MHQSRRMPLGELEAHAVAEECAALAVHDLEPAAPLEQVGEPRNE